MFLRNPSKTKEKKEHGFNADMSGGRGDFTSLLVFS